MSTQDEDLEKFAAIMRTARAIRGLDPALRKDDRESIGEKINRWQRLRMPELPACWRELREYDRQWPALFAQERERILAACGEGRVLDVQHIGSTAIPHLAAKSVIDLVVVFREAVLSPDQRRNLASVGYRYFGNSPCDPEATWFWNTESLQCCFLAHVVGPSNPWPETAINFRDYLRAHPAECSRYEALKRRLAAEKERSLLEYSLDKLKLFHQISERATAWRRRGRLVHQRFEDQVRRTPQRFAAVAADHHLSYAELNRRANRLAHRLRELGAGPEELVVICLGRSVDTLVALLAALKTGSAYVPLDPTLPPRRLATMLDSLPEPLLVTESAWLNRLPVPPRLLALDRNREAIAGASAENPDVEVAPANLVYVLFTSGSTGRPKGVAVEHRQLLNYVDGMLGRLELSETTSFAVVSTLAADLVNTAIFPTWSTGGCLHVLSRERATTPDALEEYLRGHAIDYLKIVPSHLSALLAASRSAVPLPRRGLVIGGEALSWQLVDQIRQHDPGCRIINSYGPTEATVAVLTHEVEPGPRHGPTAPLGQPLPHTRIEVLDGLLTPVPDAACGELCIAGASLGRGYLGQSALTAERFIPDPRSSRPGARLYRTGDRVRRQDGGHLEFAGRFDQQVKIRGHRVELGEIEAVLSAYPAVTRVVVRVWEKRSGEKQLAAYAVPRRRSDLAAPEAGAAGLRLEADLRQYARTRFAAEMVPSSFVVLETLPLTPNGKIDRRALPPPGKDRTALSSAYLAPRTPLERMLADLWSRLLEVERIGVEDHLIELGSHSLLAMQVASRLRGTWGVDLPLASVLRARTVASLAAAVERRRRLGGGDEIPPPQALPRATGQPFPQSLAQERYWSQRHLELTRNDLVAFKLSGSLDPATLERSVGQIVARHEVLRTRYGELDGEPIQVVQPAVSVRMAMVDLQRLTGGDRGVELRRVRAEEAGRPYDLGQTPLFRLALVRNRAEEHILLFFVHHIAFDGWSAVLFGKELAAIYGAYSRRQPSPLPAPPFQYRDYVSWQRRYLDGGHWKRQLSYWRGQLKGVVATPLLPVDRPRPPVQSCRGAVVRLELSEEMTRELRGLGAGEGATLYMTLLAAFKALLYHLRPQEDVAVLSLCANRNRAELENIVGCFMNVLPLRTRLSAEHTFRQLLQRVRDVTLEAYSHSDIPLERLIAELLPRRDRTLDELFLFRVLFAMQRTPAALTADRSGVRIERCAIPQDRMYNDLLFFLDEADGKVAGIVKFNTDILDAATIQEMVERYTMILHEVVCDAERRLSRLLSNRPPMPAAGDLKINL